MNDEEFNLEILFSRIDNFSGMVRERTCNEIAKLLNNMLYYQKVLDRLIIWTQNQNLESLNIHAPIILIRAKDLNNEIKLPEFKYLKGFLKYNSILTWLLFSELYKMSIDVQEFNYNFSEPVPVGFQPDNFFTKYIQNFIPPVYSDIAMELEKNKRLPFTRTWGWEWKKLLERDKIKPDKSALDFWGRQDDYRYVAFDSKMSEYYRSAYLRAINRFLNNKSISFEEAILFSLKAIPIDFELWKIKPNLTPKWFPSLIDNNKKEIDISQSEIIQQIGHVWDSQFNNDFIISECSGLIGDGEKHNELELYGFFQKTSGSKEPDHEKLSSALHYGTSIGKGGINYLRFGGEIKPNLFEEHIVAVEDWDIVPISFSALPLNSLRWQWWRIWRAIWFPAPYLIKNYIKIENKPNKISFIDNNYEVAYWYDWVNNLREQVLANLPPSTGQALMIKKDLLTKIIDEEGFNFCWLLKLTSFTRNYSHEKFEEISSYKLFGNTKIIKR